jgi:hypothetical protein
VSEPTIKQLAQARERGEVVPLFANAEQQIEAMERLDGGQRLAVVLASAPIRPSPDEREPLDPETVERIADHIATARQELMQAMKRLFLDIEQKGASDLHMRVGFQALDLDEILRMLAEEYGS